MPNSAKASRANAKEPAQERSLTRNGGLAAAAVYERVVDADLAGVWENVFDWEHLPWLHDQAFESIDLLDSGDWGWCAEIGFPGGGQATVELVVDRASGQYVARTAEGAGAPSEIWTTLSPAMEAGDPARSTRIKVEFCVPKAEPAAMELIGKAYLAGYAQLWDQDEEMMRVRAMRSSGEGALASSDPPAPLDLGADSDLRSRVPMRFEWGGHPFRLVEQGGRLLAHSVECSHWGGPLEECAVSKGEIICPWHGYRFDVALGRSSDGRNLRLRRAPQIVLDAASGHWMATN
ncbi:MAG: Rieske 2Fe-2S domain-containing protein [Myxococcota bacterium]